MPSPLHFKPLLLRFSTTATSSLPVCTGCPVSQLAAAGQAGGFPPCVIQSPWGMCCIVRGDSSQRYSAHYSPSRTITHSQYPPGSEENIDQRSLPPHPGYRLGKNNYDTTAINSWWGCLAAADRANVLWRSRPSPAGASPMHPGLQTGPKMNAGAISSDSPSALYSQMLPTQRWDQGSKQLRRLGGSTQSSDASASITIYNGVLNTYNELVSLSYRSSFTPSLVAHTTQVPTATSLHTSLVSDTVSQALPCCSETFTAAGTPCLARVLCMSPQALRWPLMPSSLKQKHVSTNNKNKNSNTRALKAASKNTCLVSWLIYSND